MTFLCPCHSGELYSTCCEIWHKGKYPENARQLMRSRYSAYAKHNSEYIIRTTHPDSPYFKSNKGEWTSQILDFCRNTQFDDLKILEFIDGERMAYVTFLAKLSQSGKDASFTEKSYFEKIGPQWLYCKGVKI